MSNTFVRIMINESKMSEKYYALFQVKDHLILQ